MPSKKLSFALVQSQLHWEDKVKNFALLNDKIASIDFDCDVIVLPEMFTTAFTMNAQELAEDMNGETMMWLREKAKKTGKNITGSFIVKENNQYFNRLVWMKPNGSYSKYDKRHLFRMAEEDKFYTAGNESLIIELNGWKIKPLICYDLRFPVWSRNKFDVDNQEVKADYDVLLYIANWPEARCLAWDILLRARAVENQSFCVGVNRVGMDGNKISYNGHSGAIDAKGNYLINPIEQSEGVFQAILDYEELSSFREKFPQGLDADNFSLL